MDKTTRNYTIVLVAIGALILISVLYQSPGVSDLNDRLADNTEVSNYPYRFRVLDLENGVATMSTPRSADFPAYRALAILYPELRNESPDSPAMLEAQQEMARIQGLARKTVLAADEVEQVVWELDENWLRNHGIDSGRP